MRDGEIVFRRIGLRRLFIGERHVRAADDFFIAMVLHHDNEDMVEFPVVLVGPGSADGGRRKKRNRKC